jgi:hypothetical protein
MTKKNILVLSVVIFTTFGCNDQGLNPNTYRDPGISGTITFSGVIPGADSLWDLRVVAVPYYPIDSSYAVLLSKVISGVIPFSENLSTQVQPLGTVNYVLLLKPQVYQYIAVVQQYGQDITKQWRVVDIYGDSPSTPQPQSILVEEGKLITGINFTVDFYNLPPQPINPP